MGGSSLHARLRAATQPAHLRLESALGLLDEPIPSDRIIHVLGRLHAFHAVWEAEAGSVIPESIRLARLKLPLLEQDLRCLGVDEQYLRALPVCRAARRLCRTEASAAGTLYVLEGSTLGAKVITRALKRTHWYPSRGLHYWDPYGLATGQRWMATLAYLESLPAPWADDVVESAIATFELLQSWLAQRQPGHGTGGVVTVPLEIAD